MRISDWSSDVCSSDLRASEALISGESLLIVRMGGEFAGKHIGTNQCAARPLARKEGGGVRRITCQDNPAGRPDRHPNLADRRSEEHTSELQSLLRNSYAVFCLKKKTTTQNQKTH